MRCPFCNGQGKSGPVHINRGALGGEWLESVPCSNCEGSGEISLEQAEAAKIGFAHRLARIERDESQRECAKRLGISASALAAYEHGNIHRDGFKTAKAVIEKERAA